MAFKTWPGKAAALAGIIMVIISFDFKYLENEKYKIL